jgi:hypothetical protein
MLNYNSFTRDPEIYKKLLIGSLLVLVGVGFIPLAGWRLEHIRRNIREEDPFLPEWDDFGKYIMDGLKLLAFNLIWYSPIVLLVIVVAVAVIVISGRVASEEDLAIAIVVLNFCSIGLTFIYILPALLLSIPAYGILAESGSVSEAINPKNAYRILRGDIGGFLVAGLIAALATSILTSLGTLLCFIGVYPAYAVSYGISGQLYGKAFKQAKEKLAQSADAAEAA